MAGMFGFIGFNENHDKIHQAILNRLRKPAPCLEVTCEVPKIRGVFGSVVPQRLQGKFSSTLINTDKGVAVIEGDFYTYRGRSCINDLSYILEQFLTTEPDKIADIPFSMNGIFALTLFDKTRQLAMIAVDKHNISPLFYFEHKDGIVWCSNLWAITAAFAASAIDKQFLAQKLIFNISFDDLTWIEGVRKLVAGKVILINGQDGKRSSLYRPYETPVIDELDEQDSLEIAPALFAKRFQEQISDTDTAAVALSRGLDSRVVLASLVGSQRKLQCFTYGLKGCPDISIAEQLTQRLGLEHRVFEYDNLPENFPEYAKKTVWLSNGLHGVNRAGQAYIYSKFNEDLLSPPVMFTGILGGNIFRGHGAGSISTSGFMGKAFLGDIHIDQEICQYERLLTPDFYQLFDELIRERLKGLATEIGNLTSPVTHLRYMVSYIAGQHFAGELALCRHFFRYRAPFLDHEIIDFAFRSKLSTATLSMFYRTAAGSNSWRDRLAVNQLTARIIYNNAPELGFLWNDDLPPLLLVKGNEYLLAINAIRRKLQNIFSKPRQASGHEDCSTWYRGPLRAWLKHILIEEPAHLNMLFTASGLQEIYRQHTQGERDHSDLIGHILTCRFVPDCIST